MSDETRTPTAPAPPPGSRDRFLERRKLHAEEEQFAALADQVRELIDASDEERLRELLSRYYPADLADVLRLLPEDDRNYAFRLLDTEEAGEVLDEADDRTEELLLEGTEPARIAAIVSSLPADEAADVMAGLEEEAADHVLSLADPAKADRIRDLLAYPPDSAGGIMTTDYVAVPVTATQREARQRFRKSPGAENLSYVYAVDGDGALRGALSLRSLLLTESSAPIAAAMTRDVPSVPADMDQEQVAQVFARYDLSELPVVDPATGRLLGVVTSDDIIDVIQEEVTEDAMHAIGSDAQELEQLPPARIAMMRMPWIMATMFIELFAGLVIHVFDATLTRIILLASFMPIISAISGNTGLQSATIIVRGLSTGHIRIDEWRHALARQVVTTLILGGACGIALGLVGALWYGKPSFGLVVALGMFASVNIAGVVGTTVPLISKRLGFDPALTAGPFETAFQDVVGISIFLSLATLMLRYLR